MPTTTRLAVLLTLLVAACAAPNRNDQPTPGDCAPGLADCDEDFVCETDVRSPTACGGCGIVCPSGANSHPTCSLGRCGLECLPGWGDCDGNPQNGCESDLGEPGHCGSCDNACAGACVGGVCETCDQNLALDSADPLDAAKALGLCEGVIAARWTLPDGSEPPAAPHFHLGHGLLPGFGPAVTPREGDRLVGISSGTARQPSDPGYRSPQGFPKDYTAKHPLGFPKESPACPGVVTGAVNDAIALELTLQAPPWAKGFAFDFDFYTFEWPNYVCSTYNDFFLSLLSPAPAGQLDANISFDPMGNPISVNSAFVSVCGCQGGPPCTAGGKTFTCPAGVGPLAGTGFNEDGPHAATGWLTTAAPVEPGATITLRLGVYDSGDGSLDSTTLLDHFRWLPKSPVVNTTPID